nr:MAG TPA: hypothetical protein [Bacteriophage sp.]
MIIESCERRFSTGSNMGRIATAENAADHEVTTVAVVPYDFNSRSDRTIQALRDWGAILFSRA